MIKYDNKNPIKCPYCNNKVLDNGLILERNLGVCLIEFTCSHCEMDFCIEYEAMV